MSRYQPSARLGARLVRLVGDRLGGGKLCIVNYHQISEQTDPLAPGEPDLATFRWQMQALADCFNVLPMHSALAALAEGSLPPRAVCITFDDGYRSTCELAMPVLREFGLTATVFITTGYIGDGSMWNDTIMTAVRQLPGPVLDLHAIGLGSYPTATVDERKRTIDSLTDVAKYLPPLRRAELTHLLTGLVGKQPSLMLTEEMIGRLLDGGIEIGAHTVSHPILTSLDDESARAEITDSKTRLEALCQRPIRYFAYPNGKIGMDFDARHVAMARAAGFEAAFTTALAPAKAHHDRFQLPRSRPWDETRFFFLLRILRWLGS